MHYSSGILSINECDGYRLDHAILAVGWDTDGSKEYLIVKNSWGTKWGESGYVRLQVKSNDGACGVLQDDTIPFTYWMQT